MASSLLILISNTHGGIDTYRVDRLDAGEYCRLRWKLTKLDGKGTAHTVVVPRELPAHVASCDCEAATYRVGDCKHIIELRARGLLAGWKPGNDTSKPRSSKL